jgi:hypothetical protein
MIPEDVEKRLLKKKRKILARKNKEEGKNFKGLVLAPDAQLAGSWDQ